MLFDLLRAIQNTSLLTTIREAGYAYPILLSIHLSAIALSAGMVLVTDARLIGFWPRSYAPLDVVRQLRAPKLIGLATVLTMGLLMAGSKAVEYARNPFFQVKMTLLLVLLIHAIIAHRLYERNLSSDPAAPIPGKVKIAAALSLILWIGVVICGRGIGYVKAPLPQSSAATSLAPTGVQR